ncbi:YbhB/YbcL family Raf kinase inhibitor-like protein [Amorphus sp. 3PC139-8]|uniref:YbhB/YbcL family Raf kinase inhibitor-like protein n=1 Tax=Amorphus sp. 3PC139-8 TaxID=2735676 RepID=UPI00345C9A3E
MTHAKSMHGPALAVAMLLLANAGALADGLDVTIEGLTQASRFPDSAAFCPPPEAQEANVSPAVHWSEGPDGTRSYAVLMTDPDVPKDMSLINKPGTVIAEHAPRITIHHWVLVDVPAETTALARGAESEGVVAGGKPIGATDHGVRGANVFTSFLAGNPDMAGTYGGYDGPCPPMNDERVHDYQVEIFALDVPSLGLSGPFTGADAEAAMKGHVLASGSAHASYTLNPDLRAN